MKIFPWRWRRYGGGEQLKKNDKICLLFQSLNSLNSHLKLGLLSPNPTHLGAGVYDVALDICPSVFSFPEHISETHGGVVFYIEHTDPPGGVDVPFVGNIYNFDLYF